MKYVLDYWGGCKGDFLCNFINYKKFINGVGPSHSKEMNLHLKFVDTMDYSNEYIENVLKQNVLIIPAHLKDSPLSAFELIKKYDYKVVLLRVEKKYLKTTKIDIAFKEYSRSSGSIVDFIKTSRKFGNAFYKNFNVDNEEELYKKYKFAKYNIDYMMIKENIEICNENRIYYFENLLKEIITSDYEFTVKHNYEIYSELSYGDIYIKKKFDTLKTIDSNFDEELYLRLLEKTWLPEEIELFGKVWYPREYGYRSY